MIKVTVNGEEKEFIDNITIAGIVKNLNLENCNIIAELDGKVVKQDDFSSVIVNNNSYLELIRFVGGG